MDSRSPQEPNGWDFYFSWEIFSVLDLLTDYLLIVNLQNKVYQNLMYIQIIQEMC